MRCDGVIIAENLAVPTVPPAPLLGPFSFRPEYMEGMAAKMSRTVIEAVQLAGRSQGLDLYRLLVILLSFVPTLSALPHRQESEEGAVVTSVICWLGGSSLREP